MTIKVSSFDRANKSLVTHSFRPGRGYIDHGQMPPIDGLPKGPRAACAAPETIPDASEHLLCPPGAKKPLRFAWVLAEDAWRPVGGAPGNRMAWTAQYLAHHGWTYFGPYDPDVKLLNARKQ